MTAAVVNRASPWSVDDVSRSFAAAVFDFDGTLVDTIGLHFDAYRDVLASRGVALSRERFDRVIGGTAAETIPKMVGAELTAEQIAAIHDEKKVRIAQLFAAAPIPVLAPSLLLRLLSGSVPLALVTTGSSAGVKQLLRRLGWSRLFGATVFGDDVRRGKPDPEGFLLAAARLGVRAEACIAFEDTRAGITAATAAGMTVIDVCRALNVPVAHVRD